MGIFNFCIFFNQTDSAFRPGQNVTGVVTLTLSKPKLINGVTLTVKGKAKCQWNEHTGTNDNSGGTLHRKGAEKYFKKEIILDTSEGQLESPVGKYTYPFSFMLPHHIPSSFKGKHGKIYYTATARVGIQWPFNKCKKEFTVRDLLNLNHYPASKNPFSTQKNMNFKCFLCTYGSINVAVRLPKTGFIKSEPIPVTVEVDNTSEERITDVCAYVIRETEWRSGKSRGHFKQIEDKLRKQSFGPIARETSKTWNATIPISDLDFPNVEKSNIIKHTYKLMVKVKLEYLSRKLRVYVPITVGDVAFAGDSKLSARSGTNQLDSEFPDCVNFANFDVPYTIAFYPPTYDLANTPPPAYSQEIQDYEVAYI